MSTTSSHPQSASSTSFASSTSTRSIDHPRPVMDYEWQAYTIGSASAESLKAIVGKRKKAANGYGFEVAELPAMEVARARETGATILATQHMPRKWLWPPPTQSGTLPAVLFEPRDLAEICSNCAEKGYICASATVGGSTCYACATRHLECKAIENVPDESDGALLLAPLSSDERRKSEGHSMFEAAQQLRLRINKSLKSIFGRTGRSRFTPGQGGYRVAFEPNRIIFEEFSRLVKEGWAKFGWLEGQVIYYGDPSLVHETVIGDLVGDITSGMSTAFGELPKLPFSLESKIRPRQFIPGVSQPDRGMALHRTLLKQQYSKAVHGLDALWVNKTYLAVRWSDRLQQTSDTSTSTLIKEGDFLFNFKHGAGQEEKAAIAGEVAFGNESLADAKTESLLWSKKAIISMTIKIDPTIKVKKPKSKIHVKARPDHSNDIQPETTCFRGSGLPVGEVDNDTQMTLRKKDDKDAENLGFTSVDPRIVAFVVRECEPRETSNHRSGLILEQYSLGKASGVKLSDDHKEDLRQMCADNETLIALYDKIDFEGSSGRDKSFYFVPFPGFVPITSTDIKLPLRRILQEGIDTFLDTLSDKWTEEDDRHPLSGAEINRLAAAVNGANIRLPLEEIRYNIITACLMQHKESLGPRERIKKGKQNLWENTATAEEHEDAGGQSTPVGLGISGL